MPADEAVEAGVADSSAITGNDAGGLFPGETDASGRRPESNVAGGTNTIGTAVAAGSLAGGGTGSASARAEPAPEHLAAVRSRIEARKVYPQIAIRNGWQGRVLVEMRLQGDGSLAGVRLLRGSGYAVLDEATIATVRRAAPFPPVASTLTVPVEYRLQ